MKKTWVLLLTLVFVLLSGCGGKSDDFETDAELIAQGMHPEIFDQGVEWGDDVKCKYEDGVLTIYGEGPLPTQGDCGIELEGGEIIRELVVEDGVTGINAEYFPGFFDVEKVTLGKDVLYIGRGTFKECANLREINIPDSVVYIGESAFADCDGLETVIADGDALKYVCEEAFNSCDALKTVVLGKNLEVIENYAFQYCDELESIELGESLQTIGKFALCGNKIKSVVLPDTLTELGEAAFGGCEQLANIQFGTGLKKIGKNAFSEAAIFELSFKSEVELGEKAFYACENLALADLSKVKNIPAEAFGECRTLNTVIFPNELSEIGNKGFYASGLQTLTLPEGLEKIGDQAFFACDIKNITFPNSITSIGVEAFRANDFVEVKLPDKLEILNNGVFCHCENLVTVTFGNSLKEICEGAFEYCMQLDNVVLPSSLQKINDGAFRATRLREITIPESVTEIHENAFRGSDTDNIGHYLTVHAKPGSVASQYVASMEGKHSSDYAQRTFKFAPIE